MNFDLHTPTRVKLAHVNMRAEKHGDESETALDLKFVLTTGNAVLERFAAGMREALYYRAEAAEAQGSIADVESVLLDLRFPSLGTLLWDGQIVGATVVVEYGIGGPANIELSDCKVNAFKLDCKAGGSVEVTFRVQTSHIPDGALDKLGRLLDGETNITLRGPELAAVPSAASTQGSKSRKPKPSGAQASLPDATETFTAAHA